MAVTDTTKMKTQTVSYRNHALTEVQVFSKVQ